MASSVDIYEHIFHAAREDVRGMEKDAAVRQIASALKDGVQGAIQKGTKALGDAGVNDLPLAEAFNNSRGGQAIAHGGNFIAGTPGALTRTRASQRAFVDGKIDDYRAAVNQQAREYQEQASRRSSRDAPLNKKFDELENSLSPEQRKAYQQDVAQAGLKPGLGPKSERPVSGGPAPGYGRGVQSDKPAGPAPGTGGDAAEQRGMSPWGVGAGVVGTGALAGLGGAYYGQQKAEDKWRKNRNLAFGAGVATGTAAPHVYNQVDRGIRALRTSNE